MEKTVKTLEKAMYYAIKQLKDEILVLGDEEIKFLQIGIKNTMNFIEQLKDIDNKRNIERR